MQTSETPDLGISFRVFDFNSCRSQLGYHFVEVMHSKVNHPDLAAITGNASLGCSTNAGATLIVLKGCWDLRNIWSSRDYSCRHSDRVGHVFLKIFGYWQK
jgi:hypothetical protein